MNCDVRGDESRMKALRSRKATFEGRTEEEFVQTVQVAWHLEANRSKSFGAQELKLTSALNRMIQLLKAFEWKTTRGGCSS